MFSNNRTVISFVFCLFALVLNTALAAEDWEDNDDERKGRNIPKNATEFSIAEIFLEQNFTDRDTEVVIFAKGEDDGFKKFSLIAPDGRIVYRFRAPNQGDNIGGREIVVESPEPADLNIVLDAYPEGRYQFFGKTFSGERFFSTAELVHNIPSPAIITFPVADDTVDRFTLDITWEPVPEAVSYLVELKNEETDIALEAQIPGDVTNFEAPAEWVTPGSEYQVSVFVINEFGNKTASELNFFTQAE
jgi:hypothetical protein